MAKAVKILTIAVPTDDKWYKDHQPSRHKGTSLDTCCATGMCSMVLASALPRLGNLTEVNIAGDYLGIAHIDCSSTASSPYLSCHRVVPAILHAIKQSGLAPRHLSLVESPYYYNIPTDATSPPCSCRLPELEVAAFDYVRELRLSLGVGRIPASSTHAIEVSDDFGALGQALGLARNLSRLDLHSWHPGCINETLLLPSSEATQHFPVLHALRLSGDGKVSSLRLAEFLRAHASQLTELELVDLGLSDDALRWVDLLQCVRDRLHNNNLQRFHFARNDYTGSVINGCVNTWWGGAKVLTQVEVGFYAAVVRADPLEDEDLGWLDVFDEVDEWVAVFVVEEDDGEAFEQIVEELGSVGVALDVMIEGYFESDDISNAQLLEYILLGT
ncbi:MAM and LDL-receptor class A domain-containing protein [Lasiodiplodia theobromae]|uniref:MAM and LDL-receptor class A domain-containing protein n=1 Tax=Lasiodiplodia theobromae TaxID=45133 RepID=UPI0015C2F896|nr:MAM and LDL-receptor class A domain-containing protein [Lasiodiplodia theobromae]KAF4534945.1 MAM and LDL-receptor class A domain-containing protein [Lasiodiplodia theobromae]